jgi:hypothetical protein
MQQRELCKRGILIGLIFQIPSPEEKQWDPAQNVESNITHHLAELF